VFLLSLVFYTKLTYKSTFLVFIGIVALPAILAVLLSLSSNFDELERMYGLFDHTALLFTLLLEGDIVANNSTTTRALIYHTGIHELIKSYGLGVGFGGIEYIVGASFHSFFLQLLIDLGVIVFVILMALYFGLIIKLRSIYFYSRDPVFAYFSRASSLSLLLVIPASFAPSGIHYQLSFYLLIGFSLSILKIYKMGLFNESSIASSR